MRNSYIEIASHFIEPSNITSLVLSGGYIHEGYIELFLKNFNISQFTELHTLILYQTNIKEISQFLQHITTESLVSLTIDLSERENNNAFYSIIFPILDIQTNLKKVFLNKLDYITEEMPWPIHNTLKQLTIRDCTYHGYCNILANSRNLKILVIRNCIMNNVNEMVSSYSVTTSNPAKRQRTSIDSTGTNVLVDFRSFNFCEKFLIFPLI
jgi:hypothetical protein